MADLTFAQRRAMEIREQESAASENFAQPVAPEAAAKSNALAGEIGVTPDFVDRNPTFAQQQAARIKAQSAIKKHPVIGQWANDPRNAAVGADDIDALRKNADYWMKRTAGQGEISAPDPVTPTFQSYLSGLAGGFTDSLKQIRAGLMLGGSDIAAARNPTAANQYNARQATMRTQRLAGDIEARTPAFKSRTAAAIYGGLSSTINLAPALAASVATANPLPTLAYAGVSAGVPAYGKYRGRGATPGMAALGGGAEGAVEIGTELLPMGFLVDRFGKVGAKEFVGGLLARELPTEQIATFAQDAIDTAIANPDKTWAQFLAERPAAAYDTAVSTLTQSLVMGAPSQVLKTWNDRQTARQAQTDAAFLDNLAKGATESKTQSRDPSAFAKFLALQADGTSAENTYIPGEKVAEYFQSQDIDWNEENPWGFDASVPQQLEQALATGGDVVLKTSDFAAHVSTTPAWEALKEHVRLSPAGMSLAEAKDYEKSHDEAMAKLGDQFATETEADRAAREPQDKLYQSVRDKLTGAGFTQSAADTNAQLITARYATRAARLGQELTGAEFDAIDVNRVLPEKLGQIVAADQMDTLIAAMRKDKAAKATGPSLVEFIAKAGGIEDRGGDIASMGGETWHKGKPGRRKLIKPHAEAAQGSFVPGMKNANTLDDMAQRAWEAGYLPQFTERPTTAEFLDAIGGELGGTPVYANPPGTTEDMRNAADELRGILSQEGLDPDSASPKDIKAAVARFQEQSAKNGLEQTFGEGPRGRIVFDQGRSIIELFQSANMSTLSHELGHQWLEELRADATRDDAPDQLKADWQIVQDWFASNGHAVVDGAIPVDAHELFARGWERYAMEGKSPSSALRRVFETFKSWLLNIYQVVANLNAPISPEIRGVMDRLIATDEEITQAAEVQNIKALFTDAAAAGMTDAEFAAYQEAVNGARDEATDALLFRTMAAIRKGRTKEYKDQEARVRSEVSDKVGQLPEFRAMDALRGLKLDRGWLVETYGQDALSLLPRRVPPIYGEKNTVSADAIAELSGFRNGDEMVRAIMGIETRTRELRANDDKRSAKQVMIDEETDALMKERYGDILSDGSIEEEALTLIHNDRQGEVMASELRQLARQTKDTPTPYKIAREWARNKIAESKVNDALSGRAMQQYQRAASKAGKAAEDAILKGDADEAFRQKQAQMLNNALVAEAGKAKDQVDAAVARLGKTAKRATLKTVDQDYLDQAHALLEQVSFRTRSQRAIDRQASFEEWAAAQRAAGHDVIVPDSFAETIGQQHWSRLTVENLLGLDAAVSQILNLGRFKQKLIDAREERDYEAVVSEALNGISKLPPRPPSDMYDPNWVDRFKAGVASIDGALLKMETIFDWLDSGNSGGVFNRIVFKPIAEAQDRENVMVADYAGRIREAMEGIGREGLQRWQQGFSDPALINRETGNPFQFDRAALISIALNMGNEGNIQRLTDGYGWNEDSVRAVLDRELTAADWQFVQKTWDIIDTLWPDIEQMERRINGVAPEKVEPSPITTQHGTMRGGYFPAIYDTRRDYTAEQQSGLAANLLEGSYTRATTVASSTKDRAAKVKRPILLNLGVINRHVGEVIHDITHREAIMQADRFLADNRIKKAVDDTLGPQIREQFRPWLKFVANQWANERSGNEGLGRFMQKLRGNTTIVGMGFRISTIMTQIAGYSNSFEAVGARWVTPAIAATARHPIETFKFVTERSGEIAFRMDTLDRDINQNLKQLAGNRDIWTKAKRFAFHGIGYADRMVVIPTWMGAYNKALHQGADEAGAIYAADKAVRVSQGSNSAKDMAAIQRGTGKWGELLKITTMFYSYMSAVYQRQRTLGRDVRNAGTSDLPALMARAWWLIVVPPIAAQLLGGHGPDEDEDWGTWSFKEMLFNMLGPIPGVRDIARPAWDKAAGNKGFDYSMSPVQRAGQTVIDAIGDVSKLIQGEETTRATRNVLESVGYATGLVPGQIATSTQFLVDVANGDQDPETVGEWLKGLQTGKVPE